MEYYRLKEEAVKFMLDKLATKIADLETWNKNGVDIKALEEVKPVYLKYGQRQSESMTSLGGWSKENGKEFLFTICFPSVKFMENDKFSNGKNTRELMEKIQNQIDYFYQDFINDTDK